VNTQKHKMSEAGMTG